MEEANGPQKKKKKKKSTQPEDSQVTSGDSQASKAIPAVTVQDKPQDEESKPVLKIRKIKISKILKSVKGLNAIEKKRLQQALK